MSAPSRARSLLFALGLVAVAAVTPVVTASAAAPAADAQAEAVKAPPAAKRDGIGVQAISFIGTYTYNTGSYTPDRCYDHFAPGGPGGLPFAQVYRNCNGKGLNVHMGYYYNGVFHADTTCGWVPNGASVIIVRSGGDPAGNYGTWAC